jgi:hypothetical protein
MYPCCRRRTRQQTQACTAWPTSSTTPVPPAAAAAADAAVDAGCAGSRAALPPLLPGFCCFCGCGSTVGWGAWWAPADTMCAARQQSAHTQLQRSTWVAPWGLSAHCTAPSLTSLAPENQRVQLNQGMLQRPRLRHELLRWPPCLPAHAGFEYTAQAFKEHATCAHVCCITQLRAHSRKRACSQVACICSQQRPTDGVQQGRRRRRGGVGWAGPTRPRSDMRGLLSCAQGQEADRSRADDGWQPWQGRTGWLRLHGSCHGCNEVMVSLGSHVVLCRGLWHSKHSCELSNTFVVDAPVPSWSVQNFRVGRVEGFGALLGASCRRLANAPKRSRRLRTALIQGCQLAHCTPAAADHTHRLWAGSHAPGGQPVTVQAGCCPWL